MTFMKDGTFNMKDKTFKRDHAPLRQYKACLYFVFAFLALGYAGVSSAYGGIAHGENNTMMRIETETNVDRGSIIFNRCRSCHNLKKNKGNKIGPHLEGLFNRKTASVADFSYSVALKQANFLWTADKLDLWLKNPNVFLPGNRMAYAGLLSDKDRKDLIAYLELETKTDYTP